MKHEDAEMTDFERSLVESFERHADVLESGVELEKKVTVRRVVLDLSPGKYTAGDVKGVRKLLNVSQVVFAKFLGISVHTLRGWELGKPVMPMACRMMDEIRANPAYWTERLKVLFRAKSA